MHTQSHYIDVESTLDLSLYLASRFPISHVHHPNALLQAALTYLGYLATDSPLRVCKSWSWGIEQSPDVLPTFPSEPCMDAFFDASITPTSTMSPVPVEDDTDFKVELRDLVALTDGKLKADLEVMIAPLAAGAWD